MQALIVLLTVKLGAVCGICWDIALHKKRLHNISPFICGCVQRNAILLHRLYNLHAECFARACPQ